MNQKNLSLPQEANQYTDLTQNHVVPNIAKTMVTDVPKISLYKFGIFGNFSKIRRPGHKAFFICVELNPRCVFFRNLDRDTVFQL